MWTPTLADLSPVDEVEVVDLAGLDIDARNFITDAQHAPSVRLHGPDALRIADLWRSLPPGETARCHIPPFGLRFYASGNLLAQASICWACNNIFGEWNREQLSYAFDAEQPSSRELLHLLERIIGHPAAE